MDARRGARCRSMDARHGARDEMDARHKAPSDMCGGLHGQGKQQEWTAARPLVWLQNGGNWPRTSGIHAALAM
eukprot:2325176-Pyramimonas_sp.AAC.1